MITVTHMGISFKMPSNLTKYDRSVLELAIHSYSFLIERYPHTLTWLDFAGLIKKRYSPSPRTNEIVRVIKANALNCSDVAIYQDTSVKSKPIRKQRTKNRSKVSV